MGLSGFAIALVDRREIEFWPAENIDLGICSEYLTFDFVLKWHRFRLRNLMFASAAVHADDARTNLMA